MRVWLNAVAIRQLQAQREWTFLGWVTFQSATAGAFLDGINAASLALMIVVTYQLGRAALIDVTTCAMLTHTPSTVFER